jgi:hypothetical protein
MNTVKVAVKVCAQCKKAPKGRSLALGMFYLSCCTMAVGDGIHGAVTRWNATN